MIGFSAWYPVSGLIQRPGDLIGVGCVFIKVSGPAVVRRRGCDRRGRCSRNRLFLYGRLPRRRFRLAGRYSPCTFLLQFLRGKRRCCPILRHACNAEFLVIICFGDRPKRSLVGRHCKRIEGNLIPLYRCKGVIERNRRPFRRFHIVLKNCQLCINGKFVFCRDGNLNLQRWLFPRLYKAQVPKTACPAPSLSGLPG